MAADVGDEPAFEGVQAVVPRRVRRELAAGLEIDVALVGDVERGPRMAWRDVVVGKNPLDVLARPAAGNADGAPLPGQFIESRDQLGQDRVIGLEKCPVKIEGQ